jgi:hypothetical protein
MDYVTNEKNTLKHMYMEPLKPSSCFFLVAEELLVGQDLLIVETSRFQSPYLISDSLM